MGRDNRVWYRKDTGWWMVTLAGKKTRLVKGKNDPKTRKAAEQKFAELKVVQARAPEAPTARVADVIDAFLAWAETHRSAETNRNLLWYGQAFSEYSGQLPAADLRPIHLTRWIDSKSWGQTTQRNARRSVARAFSWAKEEGLLPTNPLAGIRCPSARTRQRILSEVEFRTLLRHSDFDFKVLLYALKATGCRPKEARTLTWDMVREDRWVLPAHKTAHKGKFRVVYLTMPMRKLMCVLRNRGAESPFVFRNARGLPWTVNAMRLRITRIKRSGGLADDVCPYLLRHAFGTNAIINGVDVATIAELMGHSSLEMVAKVYCHLAEQENYLQVAVERATARLASSKPASAFRR